MKRERSSPKEIAEGLEALPAWEESGGALLRVVSFSRYKQALDFTYRVGQLADIIDHHPDLLLSYGKVEVRLTTHSEGGLTPLDWDMAHRVEGIVDEFSALQDE